MWLKLLWKNRYASIATLMGKDTEGLSEVHDAKLAVEAIQELLEAFEIL